MAQKILICDDEEGVRESLKLILSDYYETIVISEAEQCEVVVKNTPDLAMLLLDIKMPRLNGIEVLKKAKAINPKLNVIIITGYKSVETAADAVRQGASGYIIKPFKSEEILATVRKNLGVDVS